MYFLCKTENFSGLFRRTEGSIHMRYFTCSLFIVAAQRTLYNTNEISPKNMITSTYFYVDKIKFLILFFSWARNFSKSININIEHVWVEKFLFLHFVRYSSINLSFSVFFANKQKMKYDLESENSSRIDEWNNKSRTAQHTLLVFSLFKSIHFVFKNIISRRQALAVVKTIHLKEKHSR